jgi:hypothetical protein
MSPEEIQKHLEIEKPRLAQYRNFCERYEIDNFELFVALYDISEIESFMPPHPDPAEKQALNELVGTTGVAGYMDYIKSNNTFELIMQWQEKTGSHQQNAIFFTQKDKDDNHS